MRKRMVIIGGAAVAGALVATGAGVAVATQANDNAAVQETDDSEPPITGEELDRASAAALEHTGRRPRDRD